MKALILAAGRGLRLAPITNDLPKCLVTVNGLPILMKQINNLHENGIVDITIVSGYHSKLIENTVHEIWKDISIIESIDYAITNNMYSAYLGIQHMFRNRKIGSFIMMNADVFFDASVLTALLFDPQGNEVVVDIGNYLEESMKVVETDGRLTAISKNIKPEDALGSSIDVYKFDSVGGEAFFNRCVEYIENKRKISLWSEFALNDAFSDVSFSACPVAGRWYEIDNQEDLRSAEALFAK